MFELPFNDQDFNRLEEDQNNKSNNYEEGIGQYQKENEEMIQEGEYEQEYLPKKEFPGLQKLTYTEPALKENHFTEDYNSSFRTENLHERSFSKKMVKDSSVRDEECRFYFGPLNEPKEELKEPIGVGNI
mmetsp:Transcript_19216/g.17036  ORF Transcript_19216/g.17036 Transcript_19216/m.17036 type:complete len:130 (+) Transcript_19216:359-748(+)